MIPFNKKHFLLPLMLCFALCQEHSLRFDGNGDYVLIQDHSDLDLTQNYTLEAWIFPESFDWLCGIISKYHTPASHGYVLRLTSQSPYTGISFDETETNTGILYSGQWFHIAAVKETGQRRLYVNGTEYSLSGNPLNTSANTDPLRIGSDYGDRYFNGKIDEIRLWNIPRTETDIISTMELHDNSGNSHTGIILGNPTWADGYNLSGLSGDLNFDDVLNIYDTVILAAIMLGMEDGTDIQINTADTNQDGIIDIADLVLLIQWILDIDGHARSPVQKAKYFIQDRSVVLQTDGEIAGLQIELSKITIELGMETVWEKNHSLQPGWIFITARHPISIG